ncbi:tail fiber assembly protein [Hafnia alvei]|uniref:tail fiber assembly protein n=1 Tax=Hafnia alvei TaxID=569 RepID=UPI000B64A187|nr:tail fiber assembly protein [Hafnia alvei]MBI0275649.1 tail fiber assembly protein [Hafnia alvei]PNK93104.1 phage tail protein [Hafnia alvei]PNK98364.1 phage tail protein [Hafnia alvei]
MMSTYIYSAINNAFYPLALQSDYEDAGTWPDDGVDVDDSVYAEFAANQTPAGKMRAADSSGMPEWVDIPAPTQNEIVAKNTRAFNTLLRSATDAAFPLQSAVALDIATDAQIQALAALQQYAVNLASTNLTVDPVIWPKSPTDMPA